MIFGYLVFSSFYLCFVTVFVFFLHFTSTHRVKTRGYARDTPTGQEFVHLFQCLPVVGNWHVENLYLHFSKKISTATGGIFYSLMSPFA